MHLWYRLQPIPQHLLERVEMKLTTPISYSYSFPLVT